MLRNPWRAKQKQSVISEETHIVHAIKRISV
jgi:hypothetical protein